MCVSMHVSAGILGGQDWASDLLKLELRAIMNYPTRVMGTNLRSLVTAGHALSHSLNPLSSTCK